MFSNLGLLGHGKCPDGEGCTRIRCFFNHGQSRPPPRPATITSTSSVKKRPLEEVKPASSSPINTAKKSVDGTPAAKVAKPTPQHKPSSGRSLPPIVNIPKVTKVISPVTTKPPPPIAGSSTLVPILSKSSKTSPHPWADRQKGLRTLHTQFEKLYASIPNVSPELARKNAIDQELEISSTSNTAGYKRSIHHAAVSVSRRVKPDRLDHPSVGTVKESRAATEAAEKEKLSKLSFDRIEQYLLPIPDFEKWRYPNPNDDSLVNPPLVKLDGEGEEQTCGRCKKPFTVSSKRMKERMGECHFHHGRLAPERIEGFRKWIYSCCKRERGEEGCEEGIHVFNCGDDDAMLAKRVPYVRVGKGVDSGNKGGVEVLGMDCEMIYTTAGSSLARVTIVDERGTAVLDEVVRQHVPVLDVNARFSGISQEQLDEAVMDINAVRAACLMFIGPDTVLVGHGLENDLRASRILHDKIIDTAVIFPHDKGHPFRRALRDLVKEKLGIFIQDRTADLGHSSAEDAKAALDLVKWRVRDDNAGSRDILESSLA